MKPLLGFSVCCLLSFFQQVYAAEPLRTAADRPVDIQHIKLDLNVDLKKRSIQGSATIDFAALRAIRTLRLNAVDHEVSAIRGSSAKSTQLTELKWQNTGKELLVDLPAETTTGEQLQIVIDYRVRDPKTGLHFFGPSEEQPGVPLQVWSQGESTMNRYWFPCFDHPNERQSTELFATVDRGLEVLSNGKLMSKKDMEGGKVRFHWKQTESHVAYLVTLVVGKFAVGREEWRGRPVTYYVPQNQAANIKRTFGRTLEMLDYFSERFGIEYPWEKYAQVVVEQFTSGGMENTSATTLYNWTMHDKRAMIDSSPDWLIAHELGHQWWGDLVTCKDWTHLWLNEGFATYCEVLWAYHKHGKDEGDYRLFLKSRDARSGTALTRPIVDRFYAAPRTMFDSRAYPKGGWVLHMLRNRVGDDDFFLALKRYGTLYAYQTAETSDLRQTFERLLGVGLERFFYDWTERPGHPKLSVKTSYKSEDQLIQLEITQTQAGDAFQFPLAIEFVLPGDAKPVRIEKLITDKQQTFYIPVPVRPKQIRVDPELTVLAEIKEQKAQDWWRAQLLDAESIAERIRAAEYFGGRKNDADRELLQQAMTKDAFYGVRVEAAKALGRSRGDFSRDTLIKGLSQEHAKVRRACINALGNFKDDEKVEATLIDKVDNGDESYYVESSSLSALAKIQGEPNIDVFLPQLKKTSHRETIRQAALGALGRATDPRALVTLIEWTRKDKPRSCRTSAMRNIVGFLGRNEVSKPKQAEIVVVLTGYLDEYGPRIRRAAIETLRDLGAAANPAEELIAALAEHDPDGRVRASAEAAFKKMQIDEKPSKELTRLRNELSNLAKRNQELEDRLLKLESK